MRSSEVQWLTHRQQRLYHILRQYLDGYTKVLGLWAMSRLGWSLFFIELNRTPPALLLQVQVMPVAQLAPSGNFNRARAMTTPVSEIPVRTLPCANPAVYASAISAGHKPSAYTIADFNEPYGVRPREYENVKGHAMHPHLHLLHSIQQTERRQ